MYQPEEIKNIKREKYRSIVYREVGTLCLDLQRIIDGLDRDAAYILRAKAEYIISSALAGLLHTDPIGSLSLPYRKTEERIRAILRGCSATEEERRDPLLREAILLANLPREEADIHVNRMIRQSFLLLFKEMDMAHIEIDQHLQPNLMLYSVCENRLKQAIIFLGQNAVEAMPYGGSLRIRAWQDDVHHTIVIRITDTGCGLSEKDALLVSEPFYTTKEGHIGLGLTFVESVIEEVGGTLTLRKNEKRGTIAEISIPIYRELKATDIIASNLQ